MNSILKNREYAVWHGGTIQPGAEEKAASKEVMDDYELLKGKLSPEARMLLDRVEEEWYLLKEAELQATYMQGISDGLELGAQRRQKRIGMTEHKCRRVS